jgi:hypothetical protein
VYERNRLLRIFQTPSIKRALRSTATAISAILFAVGLWILAIFGVRFQTIVVACMLELVLGLGLWMVINLKIFPKVFGPMYLDTLESYEHARDIARHY